MQSHKITIWCDRIIVYSFYALSYFLPISTALVESFSGIILTSYFVKHTVIFRCALKALKAQDPLLSFSTKVRISLRSFKPEQNILNWPIGIFILANFLSMIFSQYPLLSIQGFVGKLIQATFLYFSFVESVKSKKQIMIFIVIFLISATLIVSNGLAQYVQGVDFIHGKALVKGRVVSSFKQSNDFGGYLILIIVLTISLLLPKQRPSNQEIPTRTQPHKSFVFSSFLILLVLILLLGAALTCMGLTFSRGAWMGLIFAFFFLGTQNKKIAYFLLLMVITFFSLFLPRMVSIRNVSFISDNVTSEISQDNEAIVNLQEEIEEIGVIPYMWQRISLTVTRFSAMGRGNFWKDAWGIFAESPIIGVGINTYYKVLQGHPVGAQVYPHNCYLQMAAEIGLLGLASFIWILFLLFKEALKNIIKIEDQFLLCVQLGLLAGLFGFLCHSFVDTNFYSVQLGNLMWIIMGVIVVIRNVSLEKKI